MFFKLLKTLSKYLLIIDIPTIVTKQEYNVTLPCTYSEILSSQLLAQHRFTILLISTSFELPTLTKYAFIVLIATLLVTFKCECPLLSSAAIVSIMGQRTASIQSKIGLRLSYIK